MFQIEFSQKRISKFCQTCVIYTCLGKIQNFVFAKTQFETFFRFKNRIPRKQISLTCSQIDIGVPIAIHEFQSFIFFPCLWQKFHFQEIFFIWAQPGALGPMQGVQGAPSTVCNKKLYQRDPD